MNRFERRAWIAAIKKSELPRATKTVAERIAHRTNPDGTIADPELVQLLREIDYEEGVRREQ